MAPPRLHLDADASLRALHAALMARGHDVTRTPKAWMRRDASDPVFNAWLTPLNMAQGAAAGQESAGEDVRYILTFQAYPPHEQKERNPSNGLSTEFWKSNGA